jgi:DHA1 family tetracycline resistance protein-like MFS transporter
VFGPRGDAARFVAAGLAAINFLLALRTLPESLPPERRGKRCGARCRSTSPRCAPRSRPGIGAAVAVNFAMVLWFAGMEQTFRAVHRRRLRHVGRRDRRIFMIVGIVGAIVQGGLVRRLAPRFGEARLVHGASSIQARRSRCSAVDRLRRWGVLAPVRSAGLIALGNGLTTPSLPAFASRARRTTQGVTLGALQSAAALARAAGPLVGGALYASDRPARPYLAAPWAWPPPRLLARRAPPARRRSRCAGRQRCPCCACGLGRLLGPVRRRRGCGRCASPRRAPCPPRPGTRCAR